MTYPEVPVSAYLLAFSTPQQGGGGTYGQITTFRGNKFQRGYGLGSIFTALVRTFSPLFTKRSLGQAAARIGKRALTAGVDIGADLLAGQSLGKAIGRNVKDAASNLYDDAEHAVACGWRMGYVWTAWSWYSA